MKVWLGWCMLFTLSLIQVGEARTAGTRPARSLPLERDGGNPSDILPGVVIVKLRRGVHPEGPALQRGKATIVQQIQALGVRAMSPVFPSERQLTDPEAAAGRTDLSNIYYAAIDHDADPIVVSKRLLAIDDLEYAEPKFLNHPADVPNDSAYPVHQKGYFDLMHAPEGWSLTKGDSNVVIAVVDGGTFWQHQDITSNLFINSGEDINHTGHFEKGAPPGGDENGVDDDNNGYLDDVIGWNFANNSNDPQGLSTTPIVASHGTATASVAAAATNNLLGMAGAGWYCRLMPLCASSATRDNDIAFGFEAIHYAYRNGASVINCSWGRRGFSSQFEQDVVTAAAESGALVVVAAGNDNEDNDLTPYYPPSYRNVLAVGATFASADVKPGFSNYGATIPVYAPGVGIWIALKDGSYASGSGTSFSAPLVAGLAGLLKSVHPSWTPSQLAAQIRTTADSLDAANGALAGSLGRGRINFLRALTEVHAGLEVVDAVVVTPFGSTSFIRGDTVVMRLTMKNFAHRAANLIVDAVPSDRSLRTLRGAVSVALIDSGQQVTLQDFLFLVDTLSSSRSVFVKVAWVSNGNERDVTGFRLHLFTSLPTWDIQSTPVSTALMSVKAVSHDVAWASGGDGGGTAPMVFRTENGGTTWMIATGDLPGGDLWCMTAVDSTHAWVGTGDGRIFGTTDGGAIWSAQVYPGAQSPFIDGIWFFDLNNGYALGDPDPTGRFVILHTTDGGRAWAHLANEPVGISNEAGWNNSFCWTDPQHGWFGTNQSRVWRTSDAGVSWQSSTTGSLNSVSISFKDQQNGIVGHDNGALQRTSNGGQQWIALNSPVGSIIRGISYLPGTHDAWIATEAASYHSTDDGFSWAADVGIPVQGAILHISFADTARGWGVTSIGEVIRYHPPEARPPRVSVIPERYLLYPNYPNPFNGSTIIQYDLPVDSWVEVKLYDILGRLVRTIFGGVQVMGSPRVPCDAAGLSSGVYFYRVVAEPLISGQSRFSAVGKMMLIR